MCRKWRALNQNPSIVRTKMKSAPDLELQNKTARLDSARNNMTLDWNLISNF